MDDKIRRLMFLALAAAAQLLLLLPLAWISWDLFGRGGSELAIILLLVDVVIFFALLSSRYPRLLGVGALVVAVPGLPGFAYGSFQLLQAGQLFGALIGLALAGACGKAIVDVLSGRG